jgi:hypothetical protein
LIERPKKKQLTENDVKKIQYDQKELTELMNTKNMKKPLKKTQKTPFN